MPLGDKILKHPAREEIDKRLLAGESVKEVEKWLKQKYSNQPKYWVNYMTLQSYRKHRLNLDGEILAEVKAERTQLISQERERKKQALVEQGQEYQAAKTQIAHQLLDSNNLILDLQDKIWERIQILEQSEIKEHLKDSVIVQYITQLRQLLIDYHKLLDDQDRAAARSQTNITIDVGKIQEEQRLLKEAIKETFLEIAPELLPSFLERLQQRLQGADLEPVDNSAEQSILSPTTPPDVDIEAGSVNIAIKT